MSVKQKEIDLFARVFEKAGDVYANVIRSLEEKGTVTYGDIDQNQASGLLKIVQGNGYQVATQAILDNPKDASKSKNKALKPLSKQYSGDVQAALNDISQIALFVENLKDDDFVSALRKTQKQIDQDSAQETGFRLKRIEEKVNNTDVVLDAALEEKMKPAFLKIGTFLLSMRRTETALEHIIERNQNINPEILMKSPWFGAKDDEDLSSAVQLIADNFDDTKSYFAETNFKNLDDNQENNALKKIGYQIRYSGQNGSDGFVAFVKERIQRSRFFEDIARDPEFGRRALKQLPTRSTENDRTAQNHIYILEKHLSSFETVVPVLNKIVRATEHIRKRMHPINMNDFPIPDFMNEQNYCHLMAESNFLSAIKDLTEHNDEIIEALTNRHEKVRKFVGQNDPLEKYLRYTNKGLKFNSSSDHQPSNRSFIDAFERFYKDAQCLELTKYAGPMAALQNAKAKEDELVELKKANSLTKSQLKQTEEFKTKQLGFYEKRLLRSYETRFHLVDAEKTALPSDIISPSDSSAAKTTELPSILLAEIDRFVETGLSQTPKRNLFRSTLALQENHPNMLSLTDKNGDTSNYRIKTTSPNLDDALAIKQKIQSHILNKDGIYPYRRVKNSVLQDEFVPSSKPRSSEIVNSSGLYYASMKFHENDQIVSVNFSLGLKAKEENLVEAEQRIEILKDIIAKNYEEGKWCTKREINSELKQTLKEHNWDTIDSVLLDGYEDKQHLPAYARLSPVYMRFEEGPNPTWRMQYSLTAEATEEIKGRGQNLHTSDLKTALSRGLDVMEQLREKLLAFEDTNQVSIENSNQISDIYAELPNYATHHGITMSNLSKEANTLFFDVQVERNTEVPHSEIVNDLDNNKITASFQTDPSNEWRAKEFIRKVNETFQAYLNDAYSSRDNDSNKKYVQAFRTATLRNLFQHSISTHQLDYSDINVVMDNLEAETSLG